MQRRRVTAGFVTIALMAASAGCSDTELHVPEAGAVPIPTLQTAPDDLARSPQLQVLVPRESAGISTDGESADGELLPLALDALAEIEHPPRELTGLSIYSDSVYFTFEDRGINGRSVNAMFRRGEALYISDASFDEAVTYPIAVIDPEVPARVVGAIRERLPDAVVTSLDLSPDQSATYGLVWNIGVADVQGSYATVYAEPDGSIVGVDLT